MKLPDNSIGISDLLAYRDCPRRMSAAMRRHGDDEYPELTNPSNAYGSTVHNVISLVGDPRNLSHDEAITEAFKTWGAFLDPADVARLKADLATYEDRDPGDGCRTVLNEGELRAPLMEWEGTTIYFRGRIDRLYQRLDNEAEFVHVDYKSGKWAKSPAEVDEDLQMWAYNWLIHEHFPECSSLIQRYDQLRHGVVTTSKDDAQRAQIKEWLQLAARAVLEDDDVQDDGLLKPRWNQWCPWCPIKLDCPVPRGEMTAFSHQMIDLVGIEKEGRKTVVRLDADLIESYVEQLAQMEQAEKTLASISREVRQALRGMPDSVLANLGFQLREKTLTRWGPTELREVHEMLGEDFYDVIGLSKTSLARAFGKDDERRVEVERLAESITGPATLYRARG